MPFYGSLRPITVQLVGGGLLPIGVSQDVPLVLGHRYEIRANQPVFVRPGGGGDARLSDMEVRPDTPAYFKADVNKLSIAAASGDATVWIREEDPHAL